MRGRASGPGLLCTARSIPRSTESASRRTTDSEAAVLEGVRFELVRILVRHGADPELLPRFDQVVKTSLTER
jgi:hypothetical protein